MNSSIAKTANQPLDLPTDVVTVILERLHVKPLLRFKSVSKSWCDLIKSPAFANSHFVEQRKDDNVLLVRRRLQSPGHQVLSFHDLDSPYLEQLGTNLPISDYCDMNLDFNLIGSCNGIVCLAYDLDAILCNPALREFKFLTRCPFAGDNHKISHRRWGFGNTTSNGFVVVLLQCAYAKFKHIQYSYRIKANLFDSATNSWRRSNTYMLPWEFRLHSRSIFFKGACHWSVCNIDPGRVRNILTLDVSNGVFGSLTCPEWSHSSTWSQLKILEECLAMVLIIRGRGIEVWVMKEYGVKESWTKQHVLGFSYQIYPLLILENDDAWVLIEESDGQLTSYELDTNKIKVHGISGTRASFRALVYKESLISLNYR